MKSRRLTKSDKDDIIGSAVAATLKVRWDEFLVAQKELGDAIYNCTIPSRVQDRMNSLPESYLSTTSSIKVRIGGKLCPHYTPMSTNKRIPSFATHDALVDLDPASPLAVRFKEVYAIYDGIGSDHTKLAGELRRTLYRVSTTKKLLEVWPEVIEFLDEPTEIENPPAVQFDSVRELMKALG